MRRVVVAAIVAVATLAVGGCTRTLVDYETAVYVVRPGDTLYSIAWRYGLDSSRLAELNGIADPNLIRPGQRLVLRGAAPRPPRPTAAQPRRPAAASPTRPAAASPPRPVAASPPPNWQWPTRGPVVSRFGDKRELATGIGIGGTAGQAIVAAAAGRVVYAGSGLIGYGQLIIIKHDETYLSAYGHNRRLLVAQGDAVGAGQPIAEMGLGPQRSPQLHFEIRRNGDPVDPLSLLGPAR